MLVLGNRSVGGLFRIIRRFGDDTKLSKQVYLVQSLRDRKQYVIKVFMGNERATFVEEV
jgi:hypothetical protein